MPLMPAHMRSLIEQCSQDDCTRDATYEVRNALNEPVRRCCKKHATMLVEWMNKSSTT